MTYIKSRFPRNGIVAAIAAFAAFFALSPLVSAAPGETLVIDGATSTNSTLSCAGKTVCHLTGDLTYANVILQNGGKLSHRLGTLTVTNDFTVGTGSTVAGYFVGQNVSVGHLLKVTTSSVFSLNMQNTDPAALTNITDWMSSSWYDLQVTNTDTNFNGLDINVTSACVSGGGGTALPSCFRTRNTNVNSSAKLVGNATSVALQTYSNGYFAVDGNFDVTNSHVLVDGYLQVRKDFKINFGAAYILAVKGGVLATVPANPLGFTQAGLYVGQSLMMTGTTAYPDLFMSGANGSTADNIYVENDFTAYRMQIGGTSQTAADSPNNIVVKTGKLTLNDLNYFSAGGNVYSYLAMNGTTITNFNTNNLTSGFNSIGFVSVTSMKTNAVTAFGTGLFQSIGTLTRSGDYTFTGSIDFNSVTTSNGSATDLVSLKGYITVLNGTTHTYSWVSSFYPTTVTSVTSYSAKNMVSGSSMVLSWSTFTITDTQDKDNESSQNIDVSAGSGLVVSNSTVNFGDSSVQTNGYLDINNTTWRSQNLNVNGYATLNGEKVGIYFRWGKDRYIAGSIFAGGWSIWVGTWNGTGATAPDDGNIFLTRKAAITTNGAIKVYRSNASAVDNFATAPWTTPTANTSLISQFYNAALQANGGVVQVLTGSTTGTGYINDGSNANGWDSTTAGTVVRTTFSRPMVISKVCVLQHNGGTYTPENLKLQFRNTAGTVINTQAVKLGSKTAARTCYDVNTYEANSIDTSSYPTTQMSLKELEFWGVPRDLANINSSFDSDMIYKNGVYEFGGILSTKNMYVYSDTGKKFYAIQYHNNGTFSSRQKIDLNSTDASGSVFTHSVGNELGLRFVTDTMNVGTNVVLDATNRWYLGGNADSPPVVVAANGLYAFSSHTFTHCGQTGQYGPTLAMCKSAYSTVPWAQNASYLNMVTQGIQEWTVPRTGTYTIEALGANGGRGTVNGRGWDGAYLRGDFALTQGDVIQILVGQVGPTANSNDGGGGGGTFVVKKSGTVPLIIAWGGGGGSYSNPGYGLPASTSTSWNAGASGWSGGSGGAGWTSGGYAAPGGGFTGNGASSPSVWLAGGSSFTNGWAGWPAGSSIPGGFWGGGGTHGGGWGGGGGGGYSGGGASNSSQYGGGGGGSYNVGSNTYSTVSSYYGWYSMQDANSLWNGKVVVTFNDPGPSNAEVAGGTGSITPGSIRMGAWDGGGGGFIGWYGVSAGGGGGGWALYSFSSHTFTNCSATLSTGPTLVSCQSAYSAAPWTQSTAYLGMNTQGIQEWTVPQSGTYRIDAYGAWYPSYGWGGARDRGDFFLLRGQKIKILVWQKWYNWNSSDTAGAGWSFVATYDNKPLVVAWGGGASYVPTQNIHQSAGGYAMIVGGVWYEYGWQPINGGSNGNGGSCGSNYTTCQWWGGGFYTDGTNTSYGGWKSFISGGLGGCYSYCGWFGGGGGTTSWYGGGGGGYSGGGAGYGGWNQGYGYGGGGGSYNNGANPIHTAGANGSQWYVTISFVPGNTTLASAAAGGGNLGYGWYGWGPCAGKVGNNTLGNTKGGDGGGALGGSGSNWHGGGGALGCTGGGGGTGWNSDANPYRLWSGGGAGQLVTDNASNGYGWNGGWMIRISTNSLQINGKLVANWQVGKDALLSGGAYAGAGGGWAGWSILIRAKSLNCATWNAFDVKGGAGGAGSAGTAGGGGGGGWVVAYYYTTKTGSCNYALTQGSAGASGGGADGQVGILYESVGTTFDTLKSRVVVENSPAQADGTSQITIRAYFLDVNGVPLESEYLVAEVVGSLWTGKINWGNPLPQTDANGMIAFPITSTSKGIKKVVLKNAVTYTELQEQPTITFGVPQISIAKVANKTTINSGDVVTYTISLTNSGSGDAGGDAENAIVVEDVLPTGFQYYPTGPTAGTKWDTGSGTSQYFLFPETSGDGTSGNEVRLKYVIGDGISGPPVIPGSGGLVRIIFDSRAP